jgi:hypothetical protein
MARLFPSRLGLAIALLLAVSGSPSAQQTYNQGFWDCLKPRERQLEAEQKACSRAWDEVEEQFRCWIGPVGGYCSWRASCAAEYGYRDKYSSADDCYRDRCSSCESSAEFLRRRRR